MAFSQFRNSGNAGGAGGLTTTQGSDLEVITTEGLAFKTVGETKVRLTPEWSPPPAPTASLLSIASKKGLVAAAGPDGVYLATTESVRKALDGSVSSFEPQAKVPLPMRISQLHFTADEQYLILSAESGGGLAIYEVAALNNGSFQAAFELSTNGETLRQLVPNPMPELSAFCAMVTDNGSLLMANLQERSITTGPNGQVLMSQVRCAAWSTKGKQLVAGRADGTIHQITPDGTEKGVIPKPPNMGDCYVSSVTWLENHVFLAVYLPTATQNANPECHIITRQQQPGASAPPPSFTFQKLVEPVYASNQQVPHYTVLRLQKFPPNLDELLLVTANNTDSVGMITKSKTPLTSDEPAEKITNVFTTTEMNDDSTRANLPAGDNMEDVFPIGVSLDLSSKENVYKPLPADGEVEESPGPVPAVWLLTNLGRICAWWTIYTESIRAGTTYPGLAAVAESTAGQAPTQSAFGTPAPARTTPFGAPSGNTPAFGATSTPAPAFGAASTPKPAFGAASTPTPAFGAPSFGAPAALGAKPNPFGASSDKPNPFASSSGPSAFGAPSTTAAPAFGGTSALGAKVNPWATPAKSSGTAFGSSSSGASTTAAGHTPSAPAFGTPSFGSATANPEASQPKFGDPKFGLANTSPAPAFGQSAALGAKPNPWAKPGAGATPAFGQSGFAGAAPSGKVFGSAATSTPPAGGGFSAFANKPAFGSIASTDTNTTNIFGQPATNAASESKEVSMDNDSAFGKPQAPSIFGGGSGTPFGGSTFGAGSATTPAPGLGASPFVLGSTFKPDPKTANDNEDDVKPQGESSLFGGSGGLDGLLKPSAAENATTPTIEKPKSIFESTTPTTTPAPPKFDVSTKSPPAKNFSNIFGNQQPPSPDANFVNPFAPKPKAPGEPESESELSSEEDFSDEEDDNRESPRVREETDEEDENKVKDEEDSEEDKENLAKIPEAPLPPNTTSKAAFPLGGSSSSSSDSSYLFVSDPNLSAKKSVEDAPLPPDFLNQPKVKVEDDAPLPPDFLNTPKPKPAEKQPEATPLPPFGSFGTKPKTEPEQTTPQSPEEAPLPPDFLSSGKKLTVLPEVPDDGSDLSGESDLEDGEIDEGGEEASGDDDDEQEDSEEGTEGSGVDVAKDLSPDVTIENTFDLGGRTPGYTPQGSFNQGSFNVGSSFSSFGQVAEPQRSLFGEVSRNGPALAPMRQPVFGKNARSPSPNRRTAVPSYLSRPEQQRSVSTPTMASQILGNRPQQHGASFMQQGQASFMVDPNVEAQRRAKEKAKKEEEEAENALRDPMDEGIRQTLEAEVEPTLRLDAFVAADSELASDETRQKEPTGVQCETLWRDLNRMIDLVGLNSKAMQAFLLGHTTMDKEGGRTKADLEKPDDWVLVEAEDLGQIVEGELSRELEESRVKDIDETHEAIRAMTRELSKLRAKQEDMHKVVQSYVDPEQVAVAKSLPLSAEQTSQRNEIRRVYANVVKLLAEAEESLTMLRTKMASIGRGGLSRTGGGAPTVEAVIRTINKLTTMAEKRSGDVDVLEAQMRKLRLGTPGAGAGSSPRPGSSSREGSPFVGGVPTATPSKTPLRKSVLFMSPGAFGNSFSSSVGAGGRGTPPRKKMSMYTDEERRAVLSRQGKRMNKLGMLRASLEKAGPHISVMEE